MKLNSRSRTAVNHCAVALIGLCVGGVALQGQPDRVTGQITNKERVTLGGNVNPRSQPQFDAGPVDPSMKLNYMTLMLKPSGSQQTALEQLLTEQQDRKSPNYHKWLTPEQYADRFGISPADIGKVQSWLESQGFTIDHVARSRNWLAFSGTAAQVKTVFQTEIHYYRVDGEKHFANAAAPMIPAALESLVIGVLGLDDFRSKSRAKSTTPHYTNSNGSHMLAPDDIATIYDIAPLYAKGFNGTGQKLVVVGSSDIDISDIRVFRSNWNLPPSDPQLILFGPDPGVNSDSLGEADLDIEWSGAVARNATILYVYSQTAFYAVRYAIEQDLAPVISMSVDECELFLSTADLATGRILALQANVQGITWLTASGDAGAAACDLHAPLATHGAAVYHPADIPEVTAVGGTEFNEAGTYWSENNDANGESALSYIPETSWNDSVALQSPVASGGGYSVFFAQPFWQAGIGLPAGAMRAVPDVALTASAQHDPYSVFSGGQPQMVGGTSAATPVFAGIVALLNQYEGSNGQGNINPNLYSLAQSTMDIFHDITTGSNIVPCQIGTPDCTSGAFGYSAHAGYDLVTGLGSVDAYNLVTAWNGASPDSNVVPSCNPDPVYEQQPDAQGYTWFYTIDLNETAGVATSLTGFTYNGVDYSSQITALFGASTISAKGELSATLESKDLSVPTVVLFGFTGVDAGGRLWSQELLVPFYGPQSAQGPVIGAAVNGASFAQGGIVPGEIATIFGSNLTSNIGINLTSSLPLPTTLLNDSVIINGANVALFAVDNVNGQQQFNFQVPWEVGVGSQAAVAAANNGTTSAIVNVSVLAAQPGIFNYNVGGNVFGAILHANYQPADTDHPAQAGETVLIYCTGLGLVNSPPADGAPGNGQATLLTSTVTMGGKNATVSFSGLAPGFVGLYQINAVVPSGIAGGNQPVVISIGGSSSNSVLLPTQ